MRTAIALAALLLGSAAAAGAASPPAAGGGAAAPAGPKAGLFGNPGYRPRQPQKRGAEYGLTFELGSQDQRALWRWQLELPDGLLRPKASETSEASAKEVGQGLAFGGLASWTLQEVDGKLRPSDDPAVRTQVRRDGKWVFIHEELRKKNPLQAHHDRLTELLRTLKHVTSLARHIYFEGREEAAEKAYVDKEIAPRSADLIGKLKESGPALAKAGGEDKYAADQAAVAQGLIAKALPALETLGARTSPEKLAALRQARIALEQAAEALDAEPPPRALAMLAYDAQTGLFAVFGGDHLDYLMNDLWVFDPKAVRWQQRHPKGAPEPRADHSLAGDGQGKLTMRGGYVYDRDGRYIHAGPGDWTYDLAADAWSGPSDIKPSPAGARKYREGGYLPDSFHQGPRPDAAAHGKVLASLPANTWVALKPPVKFVGERCWGTLGFDTERDMIYWYNGGHSSYSGADAIHYHLASNRWDQLVETELPLNFIGASGRSAPGWSFNRRPWMTNHTWNSYGYHPGLKRLVLAGRFTSPCFPTGWGQPDQNTYLYDPDLGDWEKRAPSNVAMGCMSAQVRHVPELGMIEWGRWRLDEARLDWKKLDVKGQLPPGTIDHSGLVHDPVRKRVLFFDTEGYGQAYNGRVHAMDVPSLKVTSFVPQGSEHIAALTVDSVKGQKRDFCGIWVLREVVHHPGTDLFVFDSALPGGYTAALDAKNNRWVGLKLPGTSYANLLSAMAYDPKRDLIYMISMHGEVAVARLDPKTLEIKTFAELAAELAAKAGKPDKK